MATASKTATLNALNIRKQHRMSASRVVRQGGEPHPFAEWLRRRAQSLQDTIRDHQIAARNQRDKQAAQHQGDTE